MTGVQGGGCLRSANHVKPGWVIFSTFTGSQNSWPSKTNWLQWKTCPVLSALVRDEWPCDVEMRLCVIAAIKTRWWISWSRLFSVRSRPLSTVNRRHWPNVSRWLCVLAQQHQCRLLLTHSKRGTTSANCYTRARSMLRSSRQASLHRQLILCSHFDVDLMVLKRNRCHNAFFQERLPTLCNLIINKHLDPVVDWVKVSVVIFDIQALSRSGLSVRVPRCQKL